MGFFKRTQAEAFSYAQKRAQEFGSDQAVIEVEGGYRVGLAKRMALFFPDVPAYCFRPIY